MRIDQLSLDNSVPPRVIFSFGMGADSSAILLRWIHEPESRDFDLDELVVVTAQTGDEIEMTKIQVEQAILPLMRERSIRFVQVAREQRYVTKGGAGVVVLDDSRSPQGVFIDGAYRLSDEMREAGTVPQSGGARICSVHSKGDALDPAIAELTRGRPFRHVVGFESNETLRVAKDKNYNTELRTGEYPLVEWDWDRKYCEDYIRRMTGLDWIKSACGFCPFALSNKTSRAGRFKLFETHPSIAVDALMMERRAIALNPAQGLVGGNRLIDMVREAGLGATVDRFDAEVAAAEHAVYRIRRILRARKDDPTKMANAARSVRVGAIGSKVAMDAQLAAGGGSLELGSDGIARRFVHRRGSTFPTSEEFYVVGPAGVLEKEHERFDQWWDAVAPVDQPIPLSA